CSGGDRGPARRVDRGQVAAPGVCRGAHPRASGIRAPSARRRRRVRRLRAHIGRLRGRDPRLPRTDRRMAQRPGQGGRLAGRAEGWAGARGSVLSADRAADAFLTRLLGNASGGATGRFRGRHRRADGSVFEGDVELKELGPHVRDGYGLIVRDRTREEGWRAFAAESAETQTALRDEADLAQRQLATLQHVTDPALNALSASQSATALPDRLRAALAADGAALVRVGAFRRRLTSANEQLLDEGINDRRQNDARAPQDDRILLIHNDPARVAALSLVNWPETVSSLIAVPVLAGGVVEGAIEVVGLRSRRSTEWEIALVQVVAARIAGRLQDESDLDAGAVA